MMVWCMERCLGEGAAERKGVQADSRDFGLVVGLATHHEKEQRRRTGTCFA